MLSLIPLLPFTGFLINATLGRRLSKGVSGAVACLAMLGAFGLSVLSAMQLLALEPGPGRVIDQHLYSWIAAGSFNADLAFRLDPLSMLMILVITGIGSLIHIYSTAYMHEESGSEYARYFSYLNLFASFMLVLVLGSNLLVMFIGWEGVGLCSYLLIGFWFKKQSANDAGKKAFVVNRIGDFAFILGMCLAFVTFGTLDFREIAVKVAPMAGEIAVFGTLSIITLLFFIGATGKSAQIPLYVWLPDAMEGPTPVSALIHAATMVTAGVYMIGRNAELFGHAPQTLEIVAVIGAATALMAGTIGLVQNDIKRVLAYSTVSQLGYMFLAMGVGAFAGGVFHLYTHAFFKALMFLGSGAVIHALHGEQDIRKMGGLRKELPITYWTFLIGALAIAGVPFLSGFFSKDEILYQTFSSGHRVLWAVGAADLAADRDLHVPAGVPDLPRPARRGRPRHDAPGHAGHGAHAGHGHGDGRARRRPPARRAAGDGHSAGDPGARLGAGRLRRRAARARRREPDRRLPRVDASTPPPRLATTALRRASPRPPHMAAVAADAPHGGPDTAPVADAHAAEQTELTLMGVSSVIALLGIGIAAYFFLFNRALADSVARSFAAVHRTLLNKYWIDELYDMAIVQPLKWASDHVLWKVVDVWIIDGIVNGVGVFVRGSAALIRMAQTGSIRTYAASLMLGVVLVLGYYLMQ